MPARPCPAIRPAPSPIHHLPHPRSTTHDDCFFEKIPTPSPWQSETVAQYHRGTHFLRRRTKPFFTEEPFPEAESRRKQVDAHLMNGDRGYHCGKGSFRGGNPATSLDTGTGANRWPRATPSLLPPTRGLRNDSRCPAPCAECAACWDRLRSSCAANGRERSAYVCRPHSRSPRPSG
jgi:hypothetical protein